MATEPHWIVGNSPQCDIRLERQTVSERHCRLTQRGRAYLLEDLQSTNGTYVNGKRLQGPQVVRRGDSVTLGQDTPLPWSSVPVAITVGRSPDCDVVIPYDAVSGQHARLEREGSQVYLIDLGSTNGTAINDPAKKVTRAPITASDFVFLGTHRVAAAELLAALPESSARATTAIEGARPDELAVGGAGASSGAPPTFASGRSWLVGLVLSVGVVAVFLAATRFFRTSEAEVDRDTVTRSERPDDTSRAGTLDDEASVVGTAVVSVETRPPENTAGKDGDSVGTDDEPDDPWDSVTEELRKAAFLLAIEEPNKQRTWPAATACAVGENTLLTTARMVTGLAGAKQQGWTLWAINEPLQLKVRINSLRVHTAFAELTGDSEKQIFFDLGLVNVSSKLPSLVELATAADLAELEPGYPLGCVGVEYEEAPLFRFQSNAAELHRAQVFGFERLEPPPAPSLLIFGASLPTRPYGAAVVNQHGKLCGVFAEFMQAPGESGLKMHYAPLVDRDSILHASSGSSDLWTDPVLPAETSKP